MTTAKHSQNGPSGEKASDGCLRRSAHVPLLAQCTFAEGLSEPGALGLEPQQSGSVPLTEGVSSMRRLVVFNPLAGALLMALAGVFVQTAVAAERDRDDVSAWIEDLRARDAAARYEAIEALGALGPAAAAALPDLEKALKDQDGLVRIMSAEALHRIAPDHGRLVQRSLGVLVDALRQGVPVLRCEAEIALAGFGRAAVPALRRLLDEGDPAVRRSAAAVLGRIGPPARRAVPQLVRLLGDGQAAVRAEAARSLGYIGHGTPQTVSALIARLEDDEPAVRIAAARALGRVGAASSEAARALARALQEADPELCCAAACGLARMGPNACAASDALATVLGHKHPDTRAHALCALVGLGPDAVPLLTRALQDERSRLWALLGLAELGAAAEPAVPTVVKLLEHEQADVRREALLSLASVGPPAAKAVTQVAQKLDDPDASVRHAAAYALGNLGTTSEPLSGRLRKALHGPDPLLAVLSARALLRVAPEDDPPRKEADAYLIQSAQSGQDAARVAAIQALGEMTDDRPAVLRALLSGLSEDEPPAVIAAASDALVALGHSAVGPLAEAARDERTRLGALLVLARIGPEAAAVVPIATDALEDPEAPVRYAALVCLGQLGPAAQHALPAVRRRLRDPDDRVRRAAAVALARIRPPVQQPASSPPLRPEAPQRTLQPKKP
ncbi:MAG TPA: hypothetical protein EYH34_00515 [Planctomycetes bacterium]|nr:hypothetical protein [Planctomycetota bacterium]